MDSECNIQNFGDLKAEIYNRKTNRVQSIQWLKEKKQTMMCKALPKNIIIEE
jgi:flagellar biosynthesis chaperone FliJ